jgi:uncharacterized membrane protein
MQDNALVALPLHPALVHFPIALLSLSWAFGLASQATDVARWGELATTFEWIGLAFVPFTMAAGFLDAGGPDFLLEPQWGEPLIWHFLCSTGAAGLFAIHAVWRRRQGPTARPDPRLDIGLTTAGFWLLVMTGLIAGEMVFG